MKTLQSILFGLVVMALASSPATAGLINQGLLGSPANLDEDLVLTSVPLNITEATDTLTIQWTPQVNGALFYTLGPPEEPLPDFSNYVELQAGPGVTYTPGQARIVGNALPVGQLSCLIISGTETSSFFQVLRASEFAPELEGPITPNGGAGITSVSPEFSWEPVAGVPYYLIFVADQPFVIEEDDQGETVVQGANIIWQAITPNTSIQYGIDDPSGTIDNDLTPPLIGNTDPDERPRYNWTVLNCYGNSVAFTSDVFGTVAGFEVQTEAPFEPPALITPDDNAQLSDDEILFQWSLVPNATSYFFYLSQYQTYANGTEILFPVWQSQTLENAVVAPASSFLTDNRYIWKVIAANDQGYGAQSDTLAFQYLVDTGHLTIITETTGGDPIDLVDIDFEVISGPGILPVATDTDGQYNRYFPLGEYIVHASKEGYLDTETAPIQILQDTPQTAIIVMEQEESAISGQVVDENGDGVFGAQVVLDPSLPGPNVTTETNLSGEFLVTLDPDLYTLTASANGYQGSDPLTVNVPQNQVVYLSSPSQDLVLEEYTYQLNGSVTNPLGQPIHLAEVTLTGGGDTFSTYTNQSGQFNFTVGDGYWTLQAGKEGFYLSSGPIQVLVAGEDVEETVILSPQEGVISGFTYLNGGLFSDDDLMVRATPAAGEPILTEVGGSGGFSIGLPAGTYTVKGVLDGFTGEQMSVTVGPGQSVSGLQVNLVPNPSSISGQVTTPNGSPVASATVSTGDVTTSTGASGNYTLQVSAGTHVITAQKSGYSTVSSQPRTVSYGQNLTNVNLQMSPNVATVTGQVSNNGVGMLGATVTATPSGNGDPTTITTGTGGNFSLGLVPGNYTLTTSVSGYLINTPQSGQYDLVLQPGAQVSNRNFSLVANTATVGGTVLGPSGALYGATITVRRVGLTTGGQTITTGVNGGFNVTVEQGYAYNVYANKTGYAQAQTVTAVLTPNQEATVSLTLTQLGASITGQVRTATNTPITGATVIATDGPNSYSAITNGSGNYTISLPPGSYEMDASAAGFNDQFLEVTVNPGQNLTGNNFSLEPNYAMIAGFVLDVDGNDVPGATVTLTKQGGGTFTAISDDGGYYEFTELTGGIFTGTAQKSGYVTQTLNIGLVVDGQVVEDADYELEIASSAFDGTVTSAGSGISSATVRATANNGDVFTTISVDNGGFDLSGLSPGQYTIEALRSGYTGEAIEGVNVNPGQTETVDMELVFNDGEISGTVTSTGGETLSGVQISAEATTTGHFYQTVTAANGGYALTGLFPGTTYDVTFAKSNYGTVVEQAVATGSTVNKSLQPNTLTISGTTVNQVGTALSNIPVRATNLDDGTISNVTSGPNGNYTFSQIATGTDYAIVSMASGNGIINAEQSVTTGTSNLVGVTLSLIQQTASIAGSVETAGVNITAQRTGGSTKNTFSNADGNYVLTNLRDGEWTVTVSKQGFQFSPSQQVVQLAVGQAATGVDFDATSTNIDITGTVVDDTGQPMAETTVKLIAAASTRTAVTANDGSFSFIQVPGLTNYDLFAEFTQAGYESSVIELDTGTQDVLNQQIVVTISLGTISGTVNAVGGDPVDFDNFDVQVNDGDVETFFNGTYSFDGLTQGEYTLTFTRAGYHTVSRTTTLTSGLDESVVDVEMEEVQNGIYIAVRDTLTGVNRNIYGALGQIWTMDQDPAVDPPLDSLRSDQSGGIQFTGLTEGTSYRIRVTKKGYQTWERGGRDPALHSIQNAVLLGRPNYVIGYLRGRQGLRYQNGHVYLRAQNGNNRMVRTDQFGSYAVEAFNGPLTIIASNEADSLTSYIYSFTVPTGATRFRDFQIRTTGQIFGTVDVAGGGVPESRALIETANFSTGTFAFRRAGQADGKYRIRGLRPGDFQVSASVEGYESPDAMALTLTAGDTAEVNFTVFNPTTSLVGVIYRGDNGDGLGGVNLTLAGPETRTRTSAGDGDYGFTDILPGEYTLTAVKQGFTSASGNVSIAEGQVASLDLTLQPISDKASGFVFDIGGDDPMEGVALELRNADTGSLIANDTSAVDGSFGFSLIAAGRFTIIPEGSYSPAERDFEHQLGNVHTDLNFERVLVQGEGTVNGVVTWRGTPLDGIEVQLDELAGDYFAETVSGQNGEFEFVAPTPARYRLRAFSDDYGSLQTGGFQLETGQVVTRNIAFKSGQFTVTVLDEDDLGVSNVPVFITKLDGTVSLTLVTNAQGQAQTDANLPDGEYTVEIISADELVGPAPYTRTLSNGEAVSLTLRHGFELVYPETHNIGDPIPIEVMIPDSEPVTGAQLYYRAPGVNFYTAIPLQPVGGVTFGNDSGSRDGGAAASGTTIRAKKGKRGLVQAEPTARTVKMARRGSDRGAPDSGNVVYGSEDGAAAAVAWRATIPAQPGTGDLAFYPRIELESGVVMGREERARIIQVSNIGIVETVRIRPDFSELQPNVPRRLTVRAFDALGTDVTSDIIDEGSIDWTVEKGQFLTGTGLGPDQVVYVYSTSDTAAVQDSISVRISQPLAETSVERAQSRTFTNRVRILGELKVNAPETQVAAGGSITLSAVATDTGGTLMNIAPEWAVTGADLETDSTSVATLSTLETVNLGGLEPIEYTQEARFTATSGRFGTVQVYATDPISGARAAFNSQGGEGGLSVYMPITSGPDQTVIADNGEDVSVAIRFKPSAMSGRAGRLTMRRPTLVDFQRFPSGTPTRKGQEALDPKAFRFLLTGNLNEQELTYTITLPLPAAAKGRNPKVAKWSVTELGWVPLGGTVTADGNAIELTIDPATWEPDAGLNLADDFSLGGISGTFAVLADAKPLAVEDLEFRPNPFSPLSGYDLSIEFTLHSLYPDVWVTIDIYNMVGMKVRTLLDQVPMAKGRYARVNGDNEPIFWDGLTDDGLQARNGRYLVHIQVKDAEGDEDELEPVVLIK